MRFVSSSNLSIFHIPLVSNLQAAYLLYVTIGVNHLGKLTISSQFELTSAPPFCCSFLRCISVNQHTEAYPQDFSWEIFVFFKNKLWQFNLIIENTFVPWKWPNYYSNTRVGNHFQNCYIEAPSLTPAQSMANFTPSSCVFLSSQGRIFRVGKSQYLFPINQSLSKHNPTNSFFFSHLFVLPSIEL